MVLSTFYMFVDGTICVAWRFLVFVFETVLGQFWGIECDSRTKSIVVDEEESVRLLDESDGKVAIVTGANTGLGEKTALHLVRRGISVVVLACRSKDRAEEARARIMEELGPNLNKKSTIEVGMCNVACFFQNGGMIMSITVSFVEGFNLPNFAVLRFET